MSEEGRSQAKLDHGEFCILESQHRSHLNTMAVELTSLARQTSLHAHPTVHAPRPRFSSQSAKNRGFGFFAIIPNITSLLGHLCPKLRRKLTRSVTIPVTTSLVSQHAQVPPGAKAVPYISFDAVVGRNSTFHDLSNEEREELGGVEYRALNALLWIIAGVRNCFFFLLLIRAFLILGDTKVSFRYATRSFHCHCPIYLHAQVERKLYATH